jgi:hypothetical protein
MGKQPTCSGCAGARSLLLPGVGGAGRLAAGLIREDNMDNCDLTK